MSDNERFFRPAKLEWVCSKCCRARGVNGVSVRARFAGETCPRCAHPGAGMEFVPALGAHDVTVEPE